MTVLLQQWQDEGNISGNKGSQTGDRWDDDLLFHISFNIRTYQDDK